jgi:hypothetical protein
VAGSISRILYPAGGQCDFYNAFTPPPTNQSKTHQWTIGRLCIQRSWIVTIEAYGPSNKSRVVDLFLNNNSQDTSGYAIYKDDQLSKVVLINYLSDNGTEQEFTSISESQTGQLVISLANFKAQ